MDTKLYMFFTNDGRAIKLIAPTAIEFPSFELDYYKTISKCGAGEGLGDKIVPETILGLRVTLACYIHDFMWALSDATWADFHYSNSVFLSNINTIILNLSFDSNINIVKNFRMYRAVTYFNAVDTVGADVFWPMKST